MHGGILKYGVGNWREIAKHVRTRTNRMCAQRWQNSLRPEVRNAKKGMWMKHEDDTLRELVNKHGCKGTWELISAGMEWSRTHKQCRERWNNYLNPKLRLEPWTEGEDAVLLNLYCEFGKLWKPKQFAAALPGRPSQCVKRRFKWLTKKCS